MRKSNTNGETIAGAITSRRQESDNTLSNSFHPRALSWASAQQYHKIVAASYNPTSLSLERIALAYSKLLARLHLLHASLAYDQYSSSTAGAPH